MDPTAWYPLLAGAGFHTWNSWWRKQWRVEWTGNNEIL